MQAASAEAPPWRRAGVGWGRVMPAVERLAVGRLADAASASPASPGRRRLLVGAAAAAGVACARPAGRASDSGAQWQAWPPTAATPALRLPRLDGSPWQLADERGRVVLLNFWASWCEPCRSEMPSLQQLQQRHAPEQLQVLAVNHREGESAVRRFIDASVLRLPVLRDTEGLAARLLGVRIFPTTVAVARNGRVAFSVVGEADWAAAPAQQWLAGLL